MKNWARLTGLTTIAAWVLAQNPAPAPHRLADSERTNIQARLADLDRILATLPPETDLFPDAAVYSKAAHWILRHEEEFFTPEYVAAALGTIERGIARGRELAGGKPSWVNRTGRLTRGYRSRVDGSLQPYGLVIPESYRSGQAVRLDVVLHGRANTLNEVSFIEAHDKAAPVPPGQDFIELEVFGRANNAYRWSGETDVFEALESVRARYAIDPNRIVLRGFSMGGAGAWHIGLHHPDLWAAVEAGAGFVETLRYVRLSDLPAHQAAALHIYDALDYAANAANVPIVGYGGEEDPQLLASVQIREQLEREGYRWTRDGMDWGSPDLRALFLVAPKTGHRFHPESKKKSDRFIDAMVARGRSIPDRIRFVTYTARYNRAFWITVDGLERHYERAEIEAERSADHSSVRIRSKNVSRLLLPDRAGGLVLNIDGQDFRFEPHAHIAASTLLLTKQDGKWSADDETLLGLQSRGSIRKRPGVQGPIDDAFMDAFLCVKPTGKPFAPEAHSAALRSLDRFGREYAKFFRADAPVRTDDRIRTEDIEKNHLILFGDPASNRLIGRVVSRLPIRWTRDRITVGSRSFSSRDHILAMIYPNPLNPQKYVVLNSGHTFHEKELRGTNALLFPRLGDFAVIRLEGDSGERVVFAGFFDERWKLAPTP